MTIQSAINKEVFVPRDERMLVAVEVKRRKRKRVSFLPTGGKGEYATYICLSVTNKRPAQLLVTKVKKFSGSSSFTRRSQWIIEQLRQVNGINPNKDCPEFDLVFDNAFDQWMASSAAEKCIFIQIMYHACQTYWQGKEGRVAQESKASREGEGAQVGTVAREGVVQEDVKGQTTLLHPKGQKTPGQKKSKTGLRKTEFVNCQSKLTGDACTMNLVIYRCRVFFKRMKNMVSNQGRPLSRGFQHPGDQRLPRSGMGSVVQKASLALTERGRRLSRAEDKTVDLMYRAQQFADTAHKLSLKKN
ncbi:syntaxin binding protein 6 (amisyn), like [Osmerus mordax]|uniref:syntaxin binding protein 6 (amisyn), like n=1 Tax=Osmerus mordax TaxID=8014 RepID=UPI0035101422